MKPPPVLPPYFTLIARGFTFNDALWCEVYLDTPLGKTRKPVSRADAFTIAGCHVMTKERGTPSPASAGHYFAKHFGIISHYDVLTSFVVVLGKKTPPDSVKPFVWSGTIEEYTATWEVD